MRTSSDPCRPFCEAPALDLRHRNACGPCALCDGTALLSPDPASRPATPARAEAGNGAGGAGRAVLRCSVSGTGSAGGLISAGEARAVPGIWRFGARQGGPVPRAALPRRSVTGGSATSAAPPPAVPAVRRHHYNGRRGWAAVSGARAAGGSSMAVSATRGGDCRQQSPDAANIPYRRRGQPRWQKDSISPDTGNTAELHRRAATAMWASRLPCARPTFALLGATSCGL